MEDKKKQLQKKFLSQIKIKPSIPVEKFLKFAQSFFVSQIVKQKRLFIINDTQFKEMKFQKFLACLQMMKIDKISIMNSKHGYYYVPQIIKNIQIVNLRLLFLTNIDLTSIQQLQILDLSKTTQISVHSNCICNFQILKKLYTNELTLLNFSKNMATDNNWCRQMIGLKIKGLFFDNQKINQNNLATQWVFALSANNILNIPTLEDLKNKTVSSQQLFLKRYPNANSHADKTTYRQLYKKIASSK